MPRAAIVVVVVATGALGFVVGRITAHAGGRSSTERAPSTTRDTATSLPSTISPPRPVATTAGSHATFTQAMQAAERDAAQAEASLPSCVQQLRVVRELVK